MAQLGYQDAKLSGTALNFVAATAGGDTIPYDDQGVLLVNNASASAVTVTIPVPGSQAYSNVANDPVSVSVAAGAIEAIGPLPRALADPSTGQVTVNYSAAASVTVTAVRAA